MYGTSSYRKSESPKSHKPEISSVALEGMVENQKLKLQNEAAHLAMRDREMTLNGELAKKSMDIDLELEKKRPGETRKNFLALGATVVFYVDSPVVFWLLPAAWQGTVCS